MAHARLSARTLLLATAPLLALMLVGVAASLWRDVLSVQLTASLGTFDVSFESVSYSSNKAYVVANANLQEVSGEGKDIAILEARNLAPGASVTYTLTIKNFGSIPATVLPTIKAVNETCLVVTVNGIEDGVAFDLGAGASKTFTVTVSVPEDCPETSEGQQLLNAAVIVTLEAVQK